ncbi:hypothetical protein [Sulfitobacter mediterraneus]|uniref:Helix-turn-helix protein n=1 Tax=Sulfitobacter mediterraneus TaxID=83219 RepID=A0A061SW39_9RHOB|nr:hypothetical protein [Sulfitobacter mediterraneus]KAJ04128.1 hypothetical protein PM02_04705 [Sulfitobacter mediterraneus]
MSRKPYKAKKKGAGRFVQLPEWLQASEAWATLKPGPRALYVELKRRYTGSNNGRIILSHRDAGKALAVHANTVGGWFKELEARGFIRVTKGHYLGPSGVGQSSHWALEELPTDDMKTAPKRFMSWRQEKNPPQKAGHPVAKAVTLKATRGRQAPEPS